MKLVSFNTLTTSSENYELDGDLTIFFEMTDEQYNNFIEWKDNTELDNIYEVYDYCLDNCENQWNTEAFENDDELGLDFSAYEITTKENIYFFG